MGKARSATIRRKLISIPTRISTSARRITLHLAGKLALGNRLDDRIHSCLRAVQLRRHLTTQPKGAPESRNITGRKAEHLMLAAAKISDQYLANLTTPTRPVDQG